MKMYCFGCGHQLTLLIGDKKYTNMPKNILDWTPVDMLCERCHDKIVRQK